MRLALVVVLAGCIESAAVVCPDGRICPDDTICALVTDPDAQLCAEPEQLASCTGKPRHARCGDNGRCYDGVCLSTACGDGRINRVDPDDPTDTNGEQCDDGNERSGDGCASDCRSNETCGNAVVDVITGEACDDGDRRSNNGCASRCQTEQPRWHARNIDPLLRVGVAMAHDLARDRVVMFGGESIDQGTWEWDTSSWSRANPLLSPTRRSHAAMAYDVARRRTVLFGGTGDNAGDTWLWNGVTWEQAATLASPVARHRHAMVYDSRRGRIVLHGGIRNGNLTPLLDDTWEWDGTMWIPITPPTKPPPRADFAMAYDPSRGVTVMYGGTATQDSRVYEYKDEKWRGISIIGPRPAAQVGARMTYDPVLRRVILVGEEPVGTGEAWSWDGQIWRAIAPPTPSPARGMGMVTDYRRARLSVFGTSVAPSAVTSHWIWNGSTWSSRATDAMRAVVTSAALDLRRGRIVGFTDRVVEFDGAAWSAPATLAGPSEPTAQLAYDLPRAYTLLFAEGTWTWDGASWTERMPATRPPARRDHRIAFDHQRGRLVLFGGLGCPADPCPTLDDTWEWDGASWQLVTSAHRPSPRRAFGFAADPITKTILLFGGIDADNALLDDTWLWTGTDWIEQHPTDHPTARSETAIAWDAARARLVLVGGRIDMDDVLNDVWEWDGTTWVRQAVVSTPRRASHALVSAVGGGVIMFGGSAVDGVPLGDAQLLRWDGAAPTDACRSAIDDDGDGLAGCADPDCWWACTPLCPPGTSCAPSAPRCGDGTCDATFEDCHICVADCTCAPVCGDAACEAGETVASCPGDC